MKPPATATRPPAPPPAEAFAAFRHRNYRLYFGGQLVSNAGTWMQVCHCGAAPCSNPAHPPVTH